MSKIGKTIYKGNSCFAYYDRYVKEDRADDMYNHSYVNQVFELSLE